VRSDPPVEGSAPRIEDLAEPPAGEAEQLIDQLPPPIAVVTTPDGFVTADGTEFAER
jgi:hypothetical protein